MTLFDDYSHDPHQFDRQSDRPDLDTTWEVSELNTLMQRALNRAFPEEVWVRGEVQGLRRHPATGHTFFDLVDKGEDGERPTAKIGVILFNGVHRRLKGGRLRRVPGFELRNDIAVRIRVKVDFWTEGGTLRLLMSDVDPAFTLGMLAANRDRVLAALAAEGLLEQNRSLEFPLVPQRIGLITSAGSAAYHDFCHELQATGLAFEIVLADVRVQGQRAAASIAHALRTLARRDLDVVVIVRGGGSRTELSVFDDEAIARAITMMSVPVLTGIGHEIDTTVADLVAYWAGKTPTACAARIAEQSLAFIGTVEHHAARVVSTARSRVVSERDRVNDLAGRSSRAARHEISLHDQTLRHAGQRLARESQAAMVMARSGLAEIARALQSDRMRLVFDRADARVSAASLRLRPRAERALSTSTQAIELADARLRAVDPARILARGFSITYGPDGRAIRRVEQVAAGDQLVTIVANGELVSTVSQVSPVSTTSATGHEPADVVPAPTPDPIASDPLPSAH